MYVGVLRRKMENIAEVLEVYWIESRFLGSIVYMA